MAFSAVGAVVDAVVGGTAVAGGVATVAAAVGEVGMAMSVVGAVTGNSTLTKVGGAMGLAGGITSLASGAFGTATSNVASDTLGDLPPAPDPNAVTGPVSSGNSTVDSLGLNSSDNVDTMDGGDLTTPVPTPSATVTPLASLDDIATSPSADAAVPVGNATPSLAQNATGNAGASNVQAATPAGASGASLSSSSASPASTAQTGTPVGSGTNYDAIANPATVAPPSSVQPGPASSAAPQNPVAVGAQLNGAPAAPTSASAAAFSLNNVPVSNLDGASANLPAVTPGSVQPAGGLNNLPVTPGGFNPNTSTTGLTTATTSPSSNFFSGVSNAQLAMGALSGVGQAYAAQKNYELGEGQLQLAQQKQANIDAQPAAGTVGIIAKARKSANSGS